ncbi:MAG TPA: hypothetical protein DCE44_09935 [Verrucomicrobiales bacterium]|nr:hypothetical protein [Verrucomicrobiales bacterium]
MRLAEKLPHELSRVKARSAYFWKTPPGPSVVPPHRSKLSRESPDLWMLAFAPRPLGAGPSMAAGISRVLALAKPENTVPPTGVR